LTGTGRRATRQQIGSKGWTAETVAGVGTTYFAPAVTGNDGSANVVALGPRNTLDFYWQTNGTSTWHPEEVKGSSVYSAPAITTYSGPSDGVRVVAQGPAGALTSYANTNGSGIWAIQTVRGPGTTGSAATVTENNGSENIAVFGVSGDVDFYWENSAGAYQKELAAPAETF
jgi:hypothetical protein